MTRRQLLASLAAAPLCAARTWDDPAFPDWSRVHIDELLTDSPWARQKSIPYVHHPRPRSNKEEFSFSQISLPGGIGFPRRGGTSPGTGSTWPRSGGGRTQPASTSTGIHTEANLTMRWSTALPVRQAMVLSEFGKARFQDPKAREILDRQPSTYIIDIAGFPAILFTNAKALEVDLAKSARLYVRGHKALAPKSVDVPEHGNHLSATLEFPRWETLSENDGAVEFTAHTGTLKIELPFKLKPMVYRGNLEL